VRVAADRALELAQTLADRAAEVGQALGAEHDQGDDEHDDDLEWSDVGHTSSSGNQASAYAQRARLVVIESRLNTLEARCA
jgi:hypothetical protein